MAGRRTIVDWSPSAHAQLAHGPAILASFLGISSPSADSRGRQRADASNADLPFGHRPRVPTDSPLGGSADRYRGSADARGFLGGRLPHPRGRDRRQILHLIMNREPLAADLAGDGVARGWFRRRGKGQDFLFGFVHSLPWARRFAAWGGFARHGADGVHRSRWTRLYLRLAPGGLSSRPVACQPVRGRCLRHRILLRPSSLLPFGAAQPRGGAPTFGPLGGHPLSPPAAETPAAGRRSSNRSFPMGHSSRAYAHGYTSGWFRSVSGLKATAKIVP